MARHNDIGKQGEALARRYLEEQGFAILDTNWRLGRAEADIIAYREGLLVFAEVKTRTNADFGDPENFVDRSKQRAYIRMANAYVLDRGREEEVRFDILTVALHETGAEIIHLPDAFCAVEQNL